MTSNASKAEKHQAIAHTNTDHVDTHIAMQIGMMGRSNPTATVRHQTQASSCFNLWECLCFLLSPSVLA